jgi:hypothetical protein
MSYSKDGKDWLGRDRVEHFDDKGNKVGTSKGGKDWLGKERTEHFDEKGNKVGVSKDGKDWLGNDRTEHFDNSGKKTGTSKVEKDIFGNNIVQHYDIHGNKTKYTKAEKNWLGQTIFKHRTGGGASNGLSGIFAVLILIVLVVVAILGTFSYPYKLVDSSISPFHLDWMNNENVWIFCVSIWVLLISSIILIKQVINYRESKLLLDELFTNPIYIIVSISSTLSVVINYLIKSNTTKNFLLFSIILTLIIIGLTYIVTRTSKFKLYILVTTIILSTSSLVYINTKSNIVSTVINISDSTIKINDTSNVAITQQLDNNDDELALHNEREYVKIQLQDIESLTNNEKIEKYRTLINYYSNEELNIPISVRFYELGYTYGGLANLPFNEVYYDSLTNNFIDKESYEKYIDSAIYYDKNVMYLNKSQIYALNNLCNASLTDIYNSSITNPQSFTSLRNQSEFTERLLFIVRNYKWILLYDATKDETKLKCKNYIIESIFLLAHSVDISVTSDNKNQIHTEMTEIMKASSDYLDKSKNFILLNPEEYRNTKKEYGL